MARSPIDSAERARNTGVALCFEDLALFFPLRADDVRLFVTLRLLDRRAAFTLCLEDHRATTTLRRRLLFHRLLNVLRGIHLADLDALDANPPLVGRLVELASDLRVDLLALVERVVELHVAEDGPKRRLCEVRDGLLVVVDLQERLLRVHHLDVDDRVGRHRRVVSGDRLLSRHVERLCPHVERVRPRDERRDEVDPRFEQLPELAEDGERLLVVRVDDRDGLPDRDDREEEHEEPDTGQSEPGLQEER
jgi:hypothetical protein